jgi:2-keto-3-deoxy-L-rhamnonate aldolase RhmA
MGIPAQFDHPDFLEALKKVIAVARQHGLRSGVQPNNVLQAEQWLKLGFDVMSWSNDVAVYGRNLMLEVGVLRKMIGR